MSFFPLQPHCPSSPISATWPARVDSAAVFLLWAVHRLCPVFNSVIPSPDAKMTHWGWREGSWEEVGLSGDQSCRPRKLSGEDPGWARRRAGSSLNAVVRQETEARRCGAPPAWAPDTSSVEPLGLGLSLTTFPPGHALQPVQSSPQLSGHTVTPAVTEQWIYLLPRYGFGFNNS